MQGDCVGDSGSLDVAEAIPDVSSLAELGRCEAALG